MLLVLLVHQVPLQVTDSRTNNLEKIITVDVIRKKINDIIENDEDFIKGSLDNLDFKKLQKLFIELLEDGKITKDEQDIIDDFIKKVIIANVREKQKKIAEEKLRNINEQKDQILNEARKEQKEKAKRQAEEAKRKAEEAKRQEKQAEEALKSLQISATKAVNEGNDDGIEFQQQQERELQQKQDLIQKETQEELKEIRTEKVSTTPASTCNTCKTSRNCKTSNTCNTCKSPEKAAEKPAASVAPATPATPAKSYQQKEKTI